MYWHGYIQLNEASIMACVIQGPINQNRVVRYKISQIPSHEKGILLNSQTFVYPKTELHLPLNPATTTDLEPKKKPKHNLKHHTEPPNH